MQDVLLPLLRLLVHQTEALPSPFPVQSCIITIYFFHHAGPGLIMQKDVLLFSDFFIGRSERRSTGSVRTVQV